MKGDSLLAKIHEINNNFPVIVLSGQEEISVAINFLKEGATYYIFENDNSKTLLWNSIFKIRENSKLKEEEVED
jgi:FixJ family two-component response regulator